jgi:hypothetical protein
MTKTLHLYVWRELLKTFLLSTIALTLLVTMGGGVANVFRSQGIDALKALRIFALLVPIAMTVVLPMAALFSATITYGRASADNELNACRAAGINIHTLLASALVLGLGVAAFSYYAWNYMIPGLTEQVYKFGQQDVADILLSDLRRNRGREFRNSVLAADRVFKIPRNELPPGTPEDRDYIMLERASFLDVEDNLPRRCGTTETAVIEFDRGGRVPQLRVDLQRVRSYDIARGQYLELDRQIIGPYSIPMPMSRKLRFRDLPTLTEYARNPDQVPEMVDAIANFRMRLRHVFTYHAIQKSLDPDLGGTGVWHAAGPDGQWEVRSQEFAVAEDDGRVYLRNATVIERSPSGRRTLTAPNGTIRVRELFDPAHPSVQIELSGGVEVRTEAGAPDDRAVKLPTETLRGLATPAEVETRLAALSDAELMDLSREMPLPRKAADVREQLVGLREQMECKVAGVIHFRASFAFSAIPVIALGAILGSILRGGQVLTAFGISCIPSLVLAIGVIVGRNLADNPSTHAAGLSVMWLADALLVAATIVIGMRYVRT